MLLLLPPPPSSLFNAINAGGPTLRRGGGGRPQKKETSLLHSSLLLHRRPGLHEIPTKHSSSSSSSSSSSMALDSVPSYPGDLGSSRATRTQQRIRKEERTWTADTYAPYDDGHQWRKYGEKKLSNSNFPRFYYRCTYKNDMKCPATKQVQQKDTSDPPLFSVTYFNHHTCNTTLRPIGSTQDTAAQSSSRKAVSICFGSRATSEQPTFLTSSAALQSPVDRANQQQDRGTYAHQFQWADGSSSTGNAPVKMEVEDLTGTSASSNATGGALSRTLLPIGQSRCIEYFQFL